MLSSLLGSLVPAAQQSIVSVQTFRQFGALSARFLPSLVDLASRSLSTSAVAEPNDRCACNVGSSLSDQQTKKTLDYDWAKRPWRHQPQMVPEVHGYVHSTESFSAIDGPGVRFLVFLQGCGFRCVFCSNPDTWASKDGTLMSSKTLMKRVERMLPYIHNVDNKFGGITVSGGEPLLQPEFTAALFHEAHARGITTCLDTTGQGTKHRHWDLVLPNTDYVLVCIKSLDEDIYRQITKRTQGPVLGFIKELETRGIPYWLRYVLLPGWTDRPQDLYQLVQYCKSKQSLMGIEVLPYHLLGTQKWDELGLEYPLKGVTVPTPEDSLKFIRALREKGLNVLCAVHESDPKPIFQVPGTRIVQSAQ